MTDTIQSPWGTFPLETERMILTPPSAEGLDDMLDAKRETWAQLSHWMIWAKGEEPSATDDAAMLKKAVLDFQSGEDGMIWGRDKVTGQWLMSTGYVRPDWENRVFEIGYWTRLSAQGKGYAQEATKFLIAHAFNELNASKVTISHRIDNDASRGVIEKCGFVFTHEEVDRNGGFLGRCYAITRA